MQDANDRGYDCLLVEKAKNIICSNDSPICYKGN